MEMLRCMSSCGRSWELRSDSQDLIFRIGAGSARLGTAEVEHLLMCPGIKIGCSLAGCVLYM